MGASNPTEGPWWETNLIWGPASLGFAIVLTVVASLKHDLRWLLWFAAPCFALAFWALVKYWLHRWSLTLSLVIAGLLIGGGMHRMYVWLGHPDSDHMTGIVLIEPPAQPQPIASLVRQKPRSTEPSESTKDLQQRGGARRRPASTAETLPRMVNTGLRPPDKLPLRSPRPSRATPPRVKPSQVGTGV